MITKILGDGNFTEPLTVHLVPPDYTNVNKGVCLCFLFNNQPPGFADIEQLTVHYAPLCKIVYVLQV